MGPGWRASLAVIIMTLRQCRQGQRVHLQLSRVGGGAVQAGELLWPS